MDQQIPDNLTQFLVWLASGPGISTLLLWINSWPFWIADITDSKFVAGLKRFKMVWLALIGAGVGGLATAATKFALPGVLDALQPYFKELWLAFTIVGSLAVGQFVVFTARNFRARMELRLEEKRAYIQANRLFIEQHGLRG